MLQLPVPEICPYSTTPDNPVGAEYIIEQKASGVPLSSVWYTWSKKSPMELVEQLVDFETQLTSICFEKHGCIYYRKDLEAEGINPQDLEARKLMAAGPGDLISSTEDMAFGPLNQMSLWQRQRATMKLNRGPCQSSFKTFGHLLI